MYCGEQEKSRSKVTFYSSISKIGWEVNRYGALRADKDIVKSNKN